MPIPIAHVPDCIVPSIALEVRGINQILDKQANVNANTYLAPTPNRSRH